MAPASLSLLSYSIVDSMSPDPHVYAILMSDILLLGFADTRNEASKLRMENVLPLNM